MSYDISFLKTKNLNLGNVYDLLETDDLNPDHEIFINKDLMNNIIAELKEAGLDFEIFVGKDKDYFELNFPSYQVAFFNSQIAISIPYWEDNSNAGLNHQVKQIANILLKNGFTGFDSQSEDFITEEYDFLTTFAESKEVVDNHLNSLNQYEKGKNFKYLGIGFVILIIGFLIWKLLK